MLLLGQFTRQTDFKLVHKVLLKCKENLVHKLFTKTLLIPLYLNDPLNRMDLSTENSIIYYFLSMHCDFGGLREKDGSRRGSSFPMITTYGPSAL